MTVMVTAIAVVEVPSLVVTSCGRVLLSVRTGDCDVAPPVGVIGSWSTLLSHNFPTNRYFITKMTGFE